MAINYHHLKEQIEQGKAIKINDAFQGLAEAKDILKTIEIDLWHDPLLSRSLFFSDRLVQALDVRLSREQLG